MSFGHVNVGLWICVFPFGRFRNNEWSRLHACGTEPPSCRVSKLEATRLSVVTIVTITVLVCLLRFIVVIALLVSAFALLLSSCIC